MITGPKAPADSTIDVPRRVLIVEDHVDSAESMSALLTLRGHEVAVAHDGPAALAIVQEFRPEVILCDISLPGGMDGYAFAGTLRANRSESRLIAVSGYGGPEHVGRALQAGFDAHLLKPVDFDVLAAEIAK